MASEIKVDTVSEKTSANGVTIDGVNIKDSKIVTANSVDSDVYVDGSIDTAHLAADAVTGAKIADDAINSEHYTDGSIDTAHLADGQVTIGKLATAVLTGATDIGADIADADLFLVDDGAGGTLRKTAASRLKTFIGSGGITGADQWRTNSNVSGDINPLTNVERNDTGGFAGIGSAMTQSSGIFTFPSTGIWLIRFDALFFGNADSRFNNGAIMKTTNNSSYAEGAYNSCLIQQTNSDNAYGTVTSSFMFDVTSTSTHKVKFYIDVDDNNTSLQGQTGVNNTTFTFLKLGDT